MALGALCAHGLRAPLVLSSGTAFKGEPVLSAKSVSFRVSIPALTIRAATNTDENPITGVKKEEEKEVEKLIQEVSPQRDVDETTRKLGLEAGLWQIFRQKNEDGSVSKTSQAKDLLTRYGGAYLATSISLSIVSFGLCYVLVNNGIDVTALLAKVGISANETGEKVGTFALAYAAHKAASPIRFPPTVALTPIVAQWFGKKSADDEKKS